MFNRLDAAQRLHPGATGVSPITATTSYEKILRAMARMRLIAVGGKRIIANT